MSDPIDPTGPSGHDDADRAWFRAQVGPIVEAEPVPDAWAAIEARLHGDAPASLAGRPAPVAARWRAVAAVILLLAGAAVVLAARQDSDREAVMAGSADGTGWYVPDDLPDGWTLRSVWVTRARQGCGTARRNWEGTTVDGSTPRLELTYVPCGSDEDPTEGAVTGPALGHGVDQTYLASVLTKPPIHELRWTDGGSWTLRASGGLTKDELVAAARVIVAVPGSVDPPIAGLRFGGLGAGGRPQAGQSVTVSLRSPDGQLVSYRLYLPGDGPDPDALTEDAPVTLAGQPLPVRLRATKLDGLEPRLASIRECCRSGTSYLGTWPGAEIEVPRSNFSSAEAGPEPKTAGEQDAYDESLQAVLASLRPATAKEWSAFVATAQEPVAHRIRAADALDDIIKPRPEPAPAGAASTTTPGHGGMNDFGPLVSPSGVETPRPAPTGTDAEINTAVYDGFTDLSGLDLRLEVDDGIVSPYRSTGATLVAINTTEKPVAITECTRALTSIGLVPASEPDRNVAHRFTIDCYGNEERTIAPGATERMTTAWLRAGGFTARHQKPNAGGDRYLGTLKPGSYLAVMVVEGRDSTVRLSVPVTVPKLEDGCAVSDAEAERWEFLPLDDEARAKAAADGDTIVDAASNPVIDEGTWHEDCHRIRADLVDGKIVGITRG